MRPMTASRVRLLAVGIVVAGLVLAGWMLPMPGPLQMRAWAQSAGVAAPLLFVLGQTVITLVPIPRTVFTLAAGLLFGPVLGVGLSLIATTISAVLAFGAVRRLGRELLAPQLDRSVLRAVDTRLRRSGWLAVASLRLIPAVPFSVLNYCSAVSSIRFRHFLLGTVGIVPGSVAVVVLGDALTGTVSPALLAVSLSCAAVGAAGLLIEARLGSSPLGSSPLVGSPLGSSPLVGPPLVSSRLRPSPGTTAPRRRRSARR